MARYEQFNIEMGGRIRAARDAAGLTRDAVAERVGVSPRFLADLECGRVGTSIQNLRKICEVLGVSADLILWGDGSAAQGTAEKIASMLAGVDAELLPHIVDGIRDQLELIEAARRTQK